MSKRRGNRLTIKLIYGTSVSNFFVSPLLLVLITILLGTITWAVKYWYDDHMAIYQKQITALEESNRNYRNALAIKEREREQMLTLAEDRFDELCAQLEYQNNKINNIKSKVSKNKKNVSKDSVRQSLKGSRAGNRAVSLQLKLKYRDLMKSIENHDVDISELRVAVNDYRERLQREREQIEHRRRLALKSTKPSGWPSSGIITSDYGYRIHPIFGYGRFHSGLDIADYYGTPIRATAAGTITYSGWMQGYGYAVVIDHGHGIKTLYGHCATLKVNVGQKVVKGQNIATMGSTGNSTGPHVHYEVLKNEQCVSPVPYLS